MEIKRPHVAPHEKGLVSDVLDCILEQAKDKQSLDGITGSFSVDVSDLEELISDFINSM